MQVHAYAVRVVKRPGRARRGLLGGTMANPILCPHCGRELEAAALSLLVYPPFMPTPLAARYCGFNNSRGLVTAHRRGKVMHAGRRGETGAFMWSREDLDAFIRGQPVGEPVAVRDGGEAGAAGNLAPAHGRLLHPSPGDGSTDGEYQRTTVLRGE